MDSMDTSEMDDSGLYSASDAYRQHLCRVMEIVLSGGDARNAAAELKHDPVLLYQYMTYLRTMGVGYRHDSGSSSQAVISFTPANLCKWLDNLMDADIDDISLPVSWNAIVRGRFVELMGRSLFGEERAEELFVVGIFSVLDILLARPMRDLLDQIAVSDDMYQALLYRKGPYAPLLFLAKAIEDAHEQRIDQLQVSLQVPMEVIYDTYNAALHWAEQR